MGLDRSSRLNQSLNTPNRPHPVLSAIQFVDQTNEIPEDGEQGASLNVRTGRLFKAGQSDQWMVGGHRDMAGKKIKPKQVKGREITLEQGLNHVMRVQRRTRGQSGVVAAGSWYDAEKGHIDLDASTAAPDRETATSLMKQRNEKAVFNLQTFETVHNTGYRPKKGK